MVVNIVIGTNMAATLRKNNEFRPKAMRTEFQFKERHFNHFAFRLTIFLLYWGRIPHEPTIVT